MKLIIHVKSSKCTDKSINELIQLLSEVFQWIDKMKMLLTRLGTCTISDFMILQNNNYNTVHSIYVLHDDNVGYETVPLNYLFLVIRFKHRKCLNLIKVKFCFKILFNIQLILYLENKSRFINVNSIDTFLYFELNMWEKKSKLTNTWLLPLVPW